MKHHIFHTKKTHNIKNIATLMNCDVRFKPCFAADNCYDNDPSTTTCWIVLLCQVILAISFLVIPCITPYCPSIASSKKRNKHSRKVMTSDDDHGQQTTRTSHAVDPNPKPESNLEEEEPITIERKKTKATFLSNKGDSVEDFLPNNESPNEQDDDLFEDDPRMIDGGICPLLSTHRSEGNFLRSNDDPIIQFPSPYLAEYTPIDKNAVSTLKHMTRAFMEQRQLRIVFIRSAGLAFLTSSLTTLLLMSFRYEDDMSEFCPNTEIIELKNWLQGSSKALSATVDGFKFFPIFLLLAYTAFLVDRWRRFLVACHSIQGRLSSIGQICGSACDAPISEFSKKQLYKIYRYLNTIHIMCLKSFSPSLKSLEIETDYVTKMGLLTEDEAYFLATMENKARDVLLTLLSKEVDKLLNESRSKNIISFSNLANNMLHELRGCCAGLHDLFIRDNPNEYVMFMNALIFMYGALIVFGYPLIFMSYSLEGKTTIGCFQLGAFIGAFFVLLSLSIPSALFNAMKNPFDSEGDGIIVDNLIAGTELCLFQNMRVLWFYDRNKKVAFHQSTKYSKSWKSGIRNSLSTSMKGSFGEL